MEVKELYNITRWILPSLCQGRKKKKTEWKEKPIIMDWISSLHNSYVEALTSKGGVFGDWGFN